MDRELLQYNVNINIEDSNWQKELQTINAVANLEELLKQILQLTLLEADFVAGLSNSSSSIMLDQNLGYILELSVNLDNDDRLQELNSQYRFIDKPTNILSFPILNLMSDNKEQVRESLHLLHMMIEEEQAINLGDLFISYQTMKRESIEQEKEFINHFIHIIVHGILHLLGYDHIDDLDAEIMEKIEIQILSKLGIDNPYL